VGSPPYHRAEAGGEPGSGHQGHLERAVAESRFKVFVAIYAGLIVLLMTL